MSLPSGTIVSIMSGQPAIVYCSSVLYPRLPRHHGNSQPLPPIRVSSAMACPPKFGSAS